MSVFSYRGTRYYGEKLPTRGMKRVDRAREASQRISEGRWVLAKNLQCTKYEPKRPDKPNPRVVPAPPPIPPKPRSVSNRPPLSTGVGNVNHLPANAPRESNAPVPNPQIRSSHLAETNPRIPPKPQPRPPRPAPPIPTKPKPPSSKRGRGRPPKKMSPAQFAAKWRKEKGQSSKMTKWPQELKEDYQKYMKSFK